MGPSIAAVWMRCPSLKVPLREPASWTFHPVPSWDNTTWRREIPGRTIRIVDDASDPMSAVASSATTFSFPWCVTFSGNVSLGWTRRSISMQRNGSPIGDSSSDVEAFVW